MQNQIIVLDGPDAVGKTTLAKKIQEKVPNTRYLHLTYRWKDKIFDYHTAAIHLAAKWSKLSNVIIDRWWPSEACYATTYRRTSAWPLQGRFCDRVALKHGVVYINCLPDHNTIERHKLMKEMRVEMYDNIDKLCDLYTDLYYGNPEHEDKGNYIDQLILSGGMQQIPYCLPYTIEKWGAHLDQFVDLIMHVGKTHRECQWKTALDPDDHNILGHRHFAHRLFVGEIVNPKYKGVFWPFYEYNNSSLYLTQALHNLWLNERECAFTNVKDKDGKVDLRYVEEAQRNDIDIIAMGNVAADTMQKHKIEPDGIIKHPSYYKRFLNGEGFKQIENDIQEVL